MEGQRHNNPLDPCCFSISSNVGVLDIDRSLHAFAFVYNGTKGMEPAPNPHYSGGS